MQEVIKRTDPERLDHPGTISREDLISIAALAESPGGKVLQDWLAKEAARWGNNLRLVNPTDAATIAVSQTAELILTNLLKFLQTPLPPMAEETEEEE
jgi:hypothetical protein